jgi:hypothetical protein
LVAFALRLLGKVSLPGLKKYHIQGQFAFVGGLPAGSRR